MAHSHDPLTYAKSHQLSSVKNKAGKHLLFWI